VRQAGYVVLGLLGGFFLAGLAFLIARAPSGQSIPLEGPPTPMPLQVHVVGAVLRPGLYAFVENSRVQDAITAAGGLTSDAQVDALNLAARLEDGQQLRVPAISEVARPTATSRANFRVLPSPPATATAQGNLININTASAEELASLPGIGPTTAQRIVEHRTENGPFQRIEDLLDVAGIGPATFDSIQALITV
jgi:competence protein ComEA